MASFRMIAVMATFGGLPAPSDTTRSRVSALPEGHACAAHGSRQIGIVGVHDGPRRDRAERGMAGDEMTGKRPIGMRRVWPSTSRWKYQVFAVLPTKNPSPLTSESQCFRVPLVECGALRAKVSVSFDIVGTLQITAR
jgi:hypothetical protein